MKAFHGKEELKQSVLLDPERFFQFEDYSLWRTVYDMPIGLIRLLEDIVDSVTVFPQQNMGERLIKAINVGSDLSDIPQTWKQPLLSMAVAQVKRLFPFEAFSAFHESLDYIERAVCDPETCTETFKNWLNATLDWLNYYSGLSAGDKRILAVGYFIAGVQEIESRFGATLIHGDYWELGAAFWHWVRIGPSDTYLTDAVSFVIADLASRV